MDVAYKNGRVEVTSSNREVSWSHWQGYCQPMGLDPYLQGVAHEEKCRHLMGSQGQCDLDATVEDAKLEVREHCYRYRGRPNKR